MICKNCGKENPDSAKFCIHCGCKLPETTNLDTENPEENSKSGKKGVAVLSAAVAVMLASGAAAFFALNGDDEKEYDTYQSSSGKYLDNQSYGDVLAKLTSYSIDPKEADPIQLLSYDYSNGDEDGATEDTFQAFTENVDGMNSGLVKDASLEAKAEASVKSQSGTNVKAQVKVEDHEEKGKDSGTNSAADQTGKDSTQKTSPTDTGENVSNQSDTQVMTLSSVQQLLNLFSDEANELLQASNDPYGVSVLSANTLRLQDCEEIEEEQAFELACYAVRESEELPEEDELYYDAGGTLMPLAIYSTGSDNSSGNCYWNVPEKLFEDYMQNMFGSHYSLSYFTEPDGKIETAGNDMIRNYAYSSRNARISQDGRVFIYVGDSAAQDAEVTVESISDTPDSQGLYTVIAKYTQPSSDGVTPDENHMQYLVKPDGNAKYGCVIVGMMPVEEDTSEDKSIVVEIKPSQDAITGPAEQTETGANAGASVQGADTQVSDTQGADTQVPNAQGTETQETDTQETDTQGETTVQNDQIYGILIQAGQYTENEVVGSWEVNSDQSYNVQDTAVKVESDDLLTFTEDGTYSIVPAEEDSGQDIIDHDVIMEGTWELQGETITCQYTDNLNENDSLILYIIKEDDGGISLLMCVNDMMVYWSKI